MIWNGLTIASTVILALVALFLDKGKILRDIGVGATLITLGVWVAIVFTIIIPIVHVSCMVAGPFVRMISSRSRCHKTAWIWEVQCVVMQKLLPGKKT